MRTIFGLVGQSGSGKTTLIQEVIARFPDAVGIVKSLTTRARRSPEDDQFYDFITVDEMRRREAAGKLIQVSEYAGNLYANDRSELDALLSEKFGINALVESGVNNLRHAGYNVTVVKILPFHNPSLTDKAREIADAQRAQTHLPADIVINNSFEPGGKEKAVQQLTNYIRSFAR